MPQKLLVVLFSVLAFACSEKKSQETITLTYWTHEDPARTELERKLIAEFEKAHPHVKIDRSTQGSTKIIELVQTAFAANQGPDIFNLSIEDEYAYLANGLVAPVDAQAAGFKNLQALRDSYLKGILDPVSKDGQIYGLPLEITNWCIYINKKVFKSAGLDPEKDYPKTWEDMMAISEKLVIRNGDILVRRGFDFRYPYYLVAFVPMVEQLGGKLVSDDGKTAIVNDEAWLTVLNYMKDWGPSGKNLGSPTYKNARSLFNKDNNDIAMATTGLYQQGRIEKDNPQFFTSGEWMVVPFPQFKDAVREVAACYYGHFLMVNNAISAEKKKMAWEFIGFLLSHGEQYLTEGGNIIQPTKALLNSSTLQKMPYASVFLDDMARGHMVYYGKSSAQLQAAIRSAVEQVMLSGVEPKVALNTLRKTCQDIIDEQ